MQRAVREERAHLVHCPLPHPAPRREAVTLEESLSMNGTSNELPSSRGLLARDPAATTGIRIWPYLAYGGLGGAVLIAVFGLTNPMAAKRATPTPMPTSTEGRSTQAPVLATAEPRANAPQNLDRNASPEQAPLAPVSSVSNPAVVKTALPSAGPRRAAYSHRGVAGAGAVATPPAATRLEDVLGERR
jgi:hypothetical protein